MAQRIEPFTVTIPAGTPIAAPVTIPVTFIDGNVSELEIDIPPGPNGLVGFKVLFAGVPMIPYRGATFIIGDDVSLRWPLSGYPTAGQWSFLAYNTGLFNHSLQVRFLIDELAVPIPAPIQLVPIG